jgi:hypothetical protein
MFRSIAFLLIICSTQLHAWNSMGHRLVAQIAIDELPVGYVKKLSHLNHVLDAIYPPRKLVNSATWMDDIRFDDIQWYTTYHYEDKYFSEDGTPLPKQCGQYARWAISTAVQSLESPRTTALNKAMALRVILHVIGDIHQPLHSIAKVSKAYPQGDAGGNYYSLTKNTVGRSLHEFWDNGAGYLISNKPVKYQDILKTARHIEKKYPCRSLPVGQVDVSHWLDESRKIGIEKVYAPLKGSSKIPAQYQSAAQKISQYQIALAGCRLAKLLKQTHVAY